MSDSSQLKNTLIISGCDELGQAMWDNQEPREGCPKGVEFRVLECTPDSWTFIVLCKK